MHQPAEHTLVGAPSEEQGEQGLVCLLGPVFLGVAIGIDALLAGLVLIAPPPVSPEELTFIGRINFRPEWDTPIYLGTGLLAVALALVLSHLRPLPLFRTAAARVAVWLPLLTGGAAIGAATAAFLQVRPSLPLSSSASHTYLGLSIGLAAVCALVAKCTSRPMSATLPLRLKAMDWSFRLRLGWLDLLVPVLVFGLLYLPGWRELAGNAFYDEGALHLDFFAFGPALALRSGAALGTDVHTYYGLGWAVVFSRLESLSYGHIIRLENTYGCLYFSGVYLFLRVLVRDRRWAAVGTALAVLFQLFASFPSVLLLWRYPSATIMRWPFDIWFFLACLFYLRTGRTRWAVAAGALVALAVVFETDTGVALGIAFAFFWVCLWRMEGARTIKRLAWTAALSGAVLAAGLGVTSRWTFLSAAFWTGWLENLKLSGRGGTLLPLTIFPSPWNIKVFVVVTTVYLMFVCAAAVGIARRRLPEPTVMLGCIALYGFFTFLYFVGRSHPSNLFRPTVPFALLIGASGGLVHRVWVERSDYGNRAARHAPGAVAWAALAMAVAVLVANPGLRVYPGLIQSVAQDRSVGGVCLFEDPDDVCGLPPEARQSVTELHALAARLRALGSSATSLAVLDQTGPLIQHMAGARPWGRYLPLFPTLVTRAQVGEVVRDLREDPPALLVMRVSPEGAPPFIGLWWEHYLDTWRKLRVSVERDFAFDSSVGTFEVWRRPPEVGRSGREAATADVRGRRHRPGTLASSTSRLG